jgi:hemoglobin-like flavoprotein
MANYVDYDEIYEQSFWRVTKTLVDGQDFFERFYDNFMTSSSEVRALFKNTDLARQKKMLHDSIVHLARFSQYKRAGTHTQKLAQRHGKHDLDVQPQLYDTWLDALVATVKERDSEFDDDIELAWRMKLAPGIEYMKGKYDAP